MHAAVALICVACVLSPSLAAPQVFPFSNLHSYFEALKSSQEDTKTEGTAEDSQVDETGPVPSQVLQAPSADQVPLNYAELLDAGQEEDAVSLTPPAPGEALPVQFLPPVPATELIAPLPSHGENTYEVLKFVPTVDDQSDIKVPSSVYPKKYRPELEKDQINHKYDAAESTDTKKKIQFPKKELPHYAVKEQQKHKQAQKLQQNVAATVEAARFPASKLEAREQAVAESGISEYGTVNSFGGPSHIEGGGDRVEFQMHGQQGPHSYKFGYDTGKGTVNSDMKRETTKDM